MATPLFNEISKIWIPKQLWSRALNEHPLQKDLGELLRELREAAPEGLVPCEDSRGERYLWSPQSRHLFYQLHGADRLSLLKDWEKRASTPVSTMPHSVILQEIKWLVLGNIQATLLIKHHATAAEGVAFHPLSIMKTDGRMVVMDQESCTSTAADVYVYASHDKNGVLLNEERLTDLGLSFKEAPPAYMDAIKSAYAYKHGAPSPEAVLDAVRRLDHARIGAPEMTPQEMENPNRGLWEFFWPEAPRREVRDAYTLVDLARPVYMRDPMHDARAQPVAIDFGTCSTVVAFMDDTGTPRLLRIGNADISTKSKPKDYENPTMLLFNDHAALLEAWGQPGHNPLVSYQRHIFSSKAVIDLLENQRHWENRTFPGALVRNLKTWIAQAINNPARYSQALILNDFAPNSEHPKNSYFQVKPPSKPRHLPRKSFYPGLVDPELDLLELYAYLLGLFINQRGRLYLDYKLTFPANYTDELKEVVTASFKRGLLRSIPETITQSERCDEFLERFDVQPGISEPSAYALAAIMEKELYPKPNEPYVAAVFDFGGGTTDFSYSFVREADAEEEEHGHAFAIEMIQSSGVPHLGGERLLERLAYRTLLANFEPSERSGSNSGGLRGKEIVFIRPEREEDPQLPMQLVDPSNTNTQGRSNMLQICERLRDLWERGYPKNEFFDLDGEGQIDSLVDRHGQKQSVKLRLDMDGLRAFLVGEVTEGISNFMHILRDSLEKVREAHRRDVSMVHVFLGGNSTRSKMVQQLFVDLLRALREGPPEVWEDLIAEGSDKDGREPVAWPISGPLQELYERFSSQGAPPSGWPSFELHMPLELDEAKPHKATAKTGAALGMLLSLSGEIKLTALSTDSGTSDPGIRLSYFVGFTRLRKFKMVLAQNDTNTTWRELCPLPSASFSLYYTTSPRALADGGLSAGDPDLKALNLHFPAWEPGMKVFIRIVRFNQVQLCCAVRLPYGQSEESIGTPPAGYEDGIVTL